MTDWKSAGASARSSLAGGGQSWSLPVQTLVFITSLTFIPAILLMMTSFTRIIIVFGLLRNALGTPSAPPNQVLLGLALFLTFFIPRCWKGGQRGPDPLRPSGAALIHAAAARPSSAPPAWSFYFH